MKGLKNLIRLHRWRLEEKRRELLALERLAGELREQSRQLDRELADEQAVARTSLEASYAYGSYAASIMQRRAKLAESIAKLEEQIIAKCDKVAEAFQELKKYEMAFTHRKRRARDKAKRREQGTLDELGVQMFIRRKRQAMNAPGALALKREKSL